MYPNQKDRAYWDSFINPFLSDLHANHNAPPSQTGLTYALSRIIWSIFNRWPAHAVGAGLRAVLLETAAEFKRRKFDPFLDDQIVANGDLPEGQLAGVFPYPPGAPTPIAGTVGPSSIKGPEQVQQIPKPFLFVTPQELQAAFDAGKTLTELYNEKVAQAAAQLAPPVCNQNVEQGCEQFKSCQCKTTEPAPVIVDPAAEKDAERNHLLAIQAYAIAKQSGANDATLERLNEKVRQSTRALLKIYGVQL